MASAGPTAAGSKRPMDAEFNLVPFIDLLTCCICFLLVSAVWTQVSKIDVKPKPNIAGEDQALEAQVSLTVHIHSGGYYFLVNGAVLEFKKVGDAYPVKDLDGKLKKTRNEHPDVTAVTVMADDSVRYKELVQVMDTCLKHAFDDISVAGSS